MRTYEKLMERLKDADPPKTFEELAKTPEGKIAVTSGRQAGKADALHKKDFDFQFGLSFGFNEATVAQEAYRSSYVQTRDKKLGEN